MTLISVDEALARLLDGVTPLEAETVVVGPGAALSLPFLSDMVGYQRAIHQAWADRRHARSELYLVSATSQPRPPL